MEKIMVTNNEYQEIQKKESSKYWQKVFAVRNSAEGDELEALKSQYMKEFHEELGKYEIEPYYNEFEAVTKVLNTFFTEDKDKGDYKLYKGFTMSGYSHYKQIADELNLTILTDCGYYRCGYNAEYRVIFSYCEGDLSLEVTNSKASFDRMLDKTKLFVKENY